MCKQIFLFSYDLFFIGLKANYIDMILQLNYEHFLSGRVLSSVLKNKQETNETGASSETVLLNTFGPNKLSVLVGKSSNPKPFFDSEKIKKLQLKTHMPDRKVKEVAKMIRSVSGRKSVEPNIEKKMSDENKVLKPFFKESTLPVQAKNPGNDETQTVKGIVCADTEEFLSLVLYHRTESFADIDVKIGIDSGQGFLKVTASMTKKPNLNEEEIPMKRFRYKDGYGNNDFKDTSVYKTLILAIYPTSKENYPIIKRILEELDIEGIEYSYSQDIKVNTHICNHSI